MLNNRLIPSLLLNDDDLIHRQKFEKDSDRYVGDPINTINVFNDFEVDEISIIDVSATNKRKINFQLLEEISGEAFFPLSYGGGIKKIEDAQTIIKLGFEKIILNSLILDDPEIIEKFAEKIGSQSTVVSIDLIQKNKKFFIFDYRDRSVKNIDLEIFLTTLNKINIGELIVTSIKYDGLMSGYDKSLVEFMQNRMQMPVIYKGGIKNFIEVKEIFNQGFKALASSSLFIMKKKDGGIVLNYPSLKERSDIL